MLLPSQPTPKTKTKFFVTFIRVVVVALLIADVLAYVVVVFVVGATSSSLWCFISSFNLRIFVAIKRNCNLLFSQLTKC